MPRIAPWYSIKPNDPQVYHDNTECTEGNNIELENKRSGTDGRRKCLPCQRLDNEGR